MFTVLIIHLKVVMILKDFLKKLNPVYHIRRKIESELSEKFENALIEVTQFRDSENLGKETVDLSGDRAYVYEATNAGQSTKLPKKIGTNVKLLNEIKLREGAWSMYGSNSLEDIERVLSLDELANMQDSAFNKYHSDPHVKSGVDNVVNYTIGQGMHFNCIVPEVQDVLTEYWVRNKLNVKQKRIVKDAYREGEYFFNYFVNKMTGNVTVKNIPPKEIDGIETHPEDVTTLFSYQRVWNTSTGEGREKYYKDINYDLIVEDPAFGGMRSENAKFFDKDRYVQFVKHGEDGEVRGRVPFDAALQYCKLYKDWVYDRARLNHERSKVVWIKKLLAGSGKQIKDIQVMRSPKGGQMLIETPSVQYRIENAKIDADSAKDDGLVLQYMIASAFNMPLSILSQRIDLTNYNSIKRGDSAFAQFILYMQDFWKDEFQNMFRFVIRQKVQVGELKQTVKVPVYSSMKKLEELYHNINEMYVSGKSPEAILAAADKELKSNKKVEKEIHTEDVTINKVFPEIIREEALDRAKVAEIHARLGLASVQTLSEQAGYNWGEELYRMLKYKQPSFEPYSRQGNNYNAYDRSDSDNVKKTEKE